MPLKKKYVPLVLILCFLAPIVHNHLHYHNYQENFSVLLVSRVDKDSHFSIECNQCFNDINKIETKLKKAKVFKKPPLFPKIQVQYNAYNTAYYKLYSRPPPILAS